jgi:hypothetical protein
VYVAVREPVAAVPVTVIGYVPAAADDVVATVIVDDEPALTEAGENDTVTPAGAPEEVNATDCELPDVTAVEIVAFAEPPADTDPEPGLSLIEKSLACEVTGIGSDRSSAHRAMPCNPYFCASVTRSGHDFASDHHRTVPLCNVAVHSP